MFDMIIDIAPKFYSAVSLPYNLQVKVMDLEIKFYFKVLPQSILFTQLLNHTIYIW